MTFFQKKNGLSSRYLAILISWTSTLAIIDHSRFIVERMRILRFLSRILQHSSTHRRNPLFLRLDELLLSLIAVFPPTCSIAISLKLSVQSTPTRSLGLTSSRMNSPSEPANESMNRAKPLSVFLTYILRDSLLYSAVTKFQYSTESLFQDLSSDFYPLIVPPSNSHRTFTEF